MDSLKPKQEIKDVNFEQDKKKIEEFLGRVNKNTLVDIFAELKNKACRWGVGSEKAEEFKQRVLKMVQQVEVEPFDEEDASAKATITTNEKRVLSAKIVFYTNAFKFNNPLIFPNILKILIHELAHVSSTDFTNLYKQAPKTGFSVGNNEEKDFSPLNEAFTEYVTDAIYSEYLRRSGDKSEYSKYIPVQVNLEIYEVYRICLDTLITSLAQESGFSREQIVQALLGHYLSADFHRHLKDLQRLVGPKVNAELRKLKNKSTISEHVDFVDSNFLSNMTSFWKDLLKVREERDHVTVIFGVDNFVGKRAVLRSFSPESIKKKD